MAVNRELLKEALSQGSRPQQTAYSEIAKANDQLTNAQGISQFATDSRNFGSGQAGYIGLAAQLATAGIGAFAQNRARKNLAEKELASQTAFATQFPQFAELAGQLSPETRQAYTMEAMKASLKAPENQIISGEQGYFAVDKNNPTGQAQPILGPNGQLIKPQKTGTTVNVGEQQGFKNSTTLRGEYLSNSKTFNEVKNGFERVAATAKDPSPAGDIGLIYGFMKINDPGSTVREGEFATAENAGSVPEKIRAQYNKVVNGTRLSQSQRADFVDRAGRLYDQAEKSQQKMVNQYTNIAKRNNIDPADVIVDFSTTAPTSSSQAIDLNQYKDTGKDEIAAEIARRGKK